jgi:hypothetical protein
MPRPLFQIGSIAKVWAATMIMQLIDGRRPPSAYDAHTL